MDVNEISRVGEDVGVAEGNGVGEAILVGVEVIVCVSVGDDVAVGVRVSVFAISKPGLQLTNKILKTAKEINERFILHIFVS